MLRSGHRPLLAGLLIVAGSLAGCTNTTVVLWTDRADAAPLAEMFNVQQNEYVMELRYDPDMNRAVRLEDTNADVVIAQSIEDESTAQLFRSVERLLNRDLDRGEFYQSLLENGRRGGRQMLLPLSFNLPVVYFLSREADPWDEAIVTIDEMREASRVFNELGDGQATRIAFSPLWNSAFLYELVRLEGFRVSESESGEPEWPLESLLPGINVAEDWVRLDNGGLDTDNSFRDQYLYDPAVRLVQQGRVQFGYDDSSTFFRRTDSGRSGLEFRWLGSEQRVLALEHVVYAGIPDSASNRPAAEAFLTWLFQPETQEQLLFENRRKRVDSFGIVGGFSSLWKISERSLPLHYPELESRVPPRTWIDFPLPSPRHWNSATGTVVRPWLIREVSGQTQARDLTASVQSWLLQQEN